MSDLVGQKLGNYRLLHVLGEGSFATVYLGEALDSPAQVAIKVFHKPLSAEEGNLFRQDEALLTRLTHPHLVRVLACGVEGSSAFLVMAYISGGTLRERHPAGSRLELSTIGAYVQQLASALQYLHDSQLVHGNLKPENLLVEHDDQVLLSDFATPLIAQRLRLQGSPEATRTSTYLAPEQIQGRIQPSSDQYALVILVYEWLSGAPPFAGSADELSTQHMFATPAPLRGQLPGLPASVEQVVLTALAKDPRHRFASVQDFAVAFLGAAQLPLDDRLLDTLPPLRTSPRVAQAEPGLTSAVTPAAAPSPPKQQEQQPATKAEPMWKVPTTFTPLIGREQEVVEIAGLLTQPEVRLVTLLGPGGIGKTRLGIAVATQLRDAFAEGVCFVGLASISDPQLVLPTIAKELGLKESATQSLLKQVQGFLGEQAFLLVLDNFEQVVAAAAEVEELLAACPQLKLLVTSRAVLHLSAEQDFPVPPLALPDLTKQLPSERIAQVAAVALFVQRAHSVLPSFQLTAANAQAIAELSVRLEGLPLAIELAAARVKLLPPQTLLARLSQRLQLLTGGSRSAPARQQTLRNTIQWSYDLLGKEEQALFRLLAVFVGGWTLEAAEAVSQAVGQADVDTLNTLSALLDNSLIQPSIQEAEEPRFLMLQSVHEYGLELLAATREREVTHAAHARYFLALAEQAGPELQGPKQAAWLERLEQEHDNLRAALEWVLEEVTDEEAKARRELAMRVSAVLEALWAMHGHYSEARTFLERVLTLSEGESAALRVRVLQATADIVKRQGDYNRAEVLAQQSLALCRELGDTRGIANGLFLLTEVAWRRGKTAETLALLEERVRLMRQVGEPWEVAEALFTLADIVVMHGEYARGQALIEEALVLFRKAGNELAVGNALVRSAFYLWLSASGDVATIRQRLQEGQALITKVGDRFWSAHSSSAAAWVALSEGEPARASQLAQESLALFREVDARWDIAMALYVVGRVEAQQGDLRAARSHYQESLALSRELGERLILSLSLEGLAGVLARQGELRWAAQMWGTEEALREGTAIALPPVDRPFHEQAVATARAQLGEPIFAAAWQEGRTMKLEQVIDDVLKMGDEAGKK